MGGGRGQGAACALAPGRRELTGLLASASVDVAVRLPGGVSSGVVGAAAAGKVPASHAPLTDLILGGLEVQYAREGLNGTVGLVRELGRAHGVRDLVDALAARGAHELAAGIALLAARGGDLKLSDWLVSALGRAVSHGGAPGDCAESTDAAALACVRMLRERWFKTRPARRGVGLPVRGEEAAAMLKALRARDWGATAPRVEREWRVLLGESKGRLRGGGPSGGQGGVPGGGGGGGGGDEAGGQQQVQGQQGQQTPMFAPDIEEDANSHFQRIYTSELQIEGVIQMLKGFKTSASQREQEVFACMIHNLFDEYRFFPRYPERELLITGKLFGSLIQHQLVSSITLGIALRYVLEALRKPLRSNMFKFGMCALEQFKQRLVEWPQYCHHILQIAHIRQAHEDLIDYIQRALNNRPAAAGQEGQGAPTGAPGGPGAPAGGQGKIPAQNAQMQQSQQPMMQAKAYGAFSSSSQDMPTSFTGFAQGFGQEPGNQLPAGMQNFASDGGENTSMGDGGNSQEPQATVEMSAAVQQTLSVVSGASAFGATTNVDMLLQRAKQVKVPDSQTQDKVFFVFNNLSNTNIESKEKDLSAALSEQDMPWFTQYLVIKRAAQEQNYHQLYLSLADRLDKRWHHLHKNIVLTTIENIRILLVDDKIRTSSSLRSLLKNLGSWLGALTLQKNKPILQKDLDFKALILEAYDKGRLIAVIPFIAKVMDACANSRIFRPPNPWTMMVLGLLAELHPIADLKLTIKFEVEVLCKTLNKELKDVKVSQIFKGREIVKEGNMDWASRNSSTGLGGLKPLPTVPDGRLLAAAASIAGMGAGGGASAGLAAAAAAMGDDSQRLGGDGSQVPVQQQGLQQGLPQQGQATPGADSALSVNISQFIVISPSIAVLQQYPQLRQHVAAAINQAIRDIIAPVVERSVTIACITTRELILKDFLFEADDAMRSAAHMMVQNLAGSLALVTCKEPLRHSMCTHLRPTFQKMAAFVNEAVDAQTLEQNVQLIAAENLDQGCTLIEKAATDKAVHNMDEALDVALQHRRIPGSPINDALVQMQNYMRFLPDALRPKREGGLQPHHRRVYEDFARLPRERLAAHPMGGGGNVSDPALQAFAQGGPGQGMPPPPQGQMQQAPPQGGPGAMPQAQGDLLLTLEKCAACMSKAEQAVLQHAQLSGSPLTSLPQGHELAQLIMQCRAIVLQSMNREEVAVGFAQKLFVRLYDQSKFGRCLLGVEWLLACLASLNDISKRVSKEVTGWVAFSDPERRLNRELTVVLVSNRLLNLSSPDYTKEVIKALDMGRNLAAIDALVAVLQHVLVDKRCVGTGDCVALLDALTKVAQVPGRKPPDALVRLLEDARNLARGIAPSGPPQQQDKGRRMVQVGKGKELEDLPALRTQMLAWLDKWVGQVQANDDRGALQVVTQLLQQGWLKGDDVTDRFFRTTVEVSVERCLAAIKDGGAAPYVFTDAVSKLIAMLLRYHDEWARSTSMGKMAMVNKFFAGIVKFMHAQHTERQANFNQKPFHRLLLRLLLDLTDVAGDAVAFSFADVLIAVQPRLLPGFAFAWLELASHRQLMPRLLEVKRSKGWVLFHKMLVGLFKYMEPFLRTAELPEPVKLMYKGMLRVLLVLLHDFPEFLCEYHLALCDAIPPSCIQLRNLILSAFPRAIVLPDPFTTQLKVDLLPDIAKAPAVLSNYQAVLKQGNLHNELDSFLKGRGPRGFLQELPNQLLGNPAEVASTGTRYNVPLINALVLYTAEHAIALNQGLDKTPTSGPSIDVYLKLVRDLDTEGRYLVLNGIANQLRFPNSHTHYLSCVLLFLFQSSKDKEIVREQITRVLIERLITNKPHPWGLLITFIELIKNPTYEFWRHDFVRSSKEIEQLFHAVAQQCLPQQETEGGGTGASGGGGGGGASQ